MYHDRNSGDKSKIIKNLFVWSFVLILMAATAAADIGQEPVQIIDKFDVEEDFGVRKALAMLGSMCQKNIVPTPNVDGVLAFRSLRNVTFEEAMDAILGENFKYEQEGKLVKVYTKDEYKKLKEDPERMICKVFTLYYITAEEASKLVAPVLSKSGTVVSTTPAKMGISDAGGSGGATTAGLGSSGDGGDSMALHDMIVVNDYPEKIEDVEKLIKSLDVRPKQVLIEGTILSVLLTEETELGIDWNTLDGVAVDSIANIASGASGLEATGFASAVTSGGLSVGITNDHVSAWIRALESVTDTTLLANPKILALNKQEGAVLIGTNLGYRSSTTIGVGGVATEGEVQFLETGTQLVFRPYIGNDGYIRMDIFPKVSSAELNEEGVPTETTTQLKSNIVVKDGGTIVIGGLFRDVINVTRNQVPLFGDLPVVGALFRGTTDYSRREEVIVLLTTHIIEEPSETDGQARADDIRRKRFGAKDGLQGIGRAKLAEDHYAKAAKCYIEGDNESAMRQLKITLTLRPSYLEAIRLKEKVIAESSPDEVEKLERIMLEAIDKEEAPKWQRR
ncbi:MAG: type II secretion system protein GspD [Planctomycetota bacterium]|jgi:type IV pilus assembly protein PilQ